MNFIERITGLSPDGGSGFTEMMLFAVLVVIAWLAIRLVRRGYR